MFVSFLVGDSEIRSNFVIIFVPIFRCFIHKLGKNRYRKIWSTTWVDRSELDLAVPGAGNLGGGGNVCSADMDQVSEIQLAKSLIG